MVSAEGDAAFLGWPNCLMVLRGLAAGRFLTFALTDRACSSCAVSMTSCRRRRIRLAMSKSTGVSGEGTQTPIFLSSEMTAVLRISNSEASSLTLTCSITVLILPTRPVLPCAGSDSTGP